MYESFFVVQKTYSSKHTYIFEKEMEPYEMVGSLCEGAIAL